MAKESEMHKLYGKIQYDVASGYVNDSRSVHMKVDNECEDTNDKPDCKGLPDMHHWHVFLVQRETFHRSLLSLAKYLTGYSQKAVVDLLNGSN